MSNFLRSAHAWLDYNTWNRQISIIQLVNTLRALIYNRCLLNLNRTLDIHETFFLWKITQYSPFIVRCLLNLYSTWDLFSARSACKCKIVDHIYLAIWCLWQLETDIYHIRQASKTQALMGFLLFNCLMWAIWGHHGRLVKFWQLLAMTTRTGRT